MNSASSLLLIGGILFFTNLILTYNRTALTQASVIYENEAFIYGENLGQSIFEEIETRYFDENTITDVVTDPNDLTDSNSLTSDDGEYSMTEFDDIDDFNGFILLDSLSGHGSYNCSAVVYYVNPDDPETKTKNAFFSKRVDLVVTNPYLMTEIKMSRIYSY